nr:hypothetical protein [Tanacetum cinerariifolium]
EILLVDAIVANVSRTEKKKKCQVVCHIHGVGSAHHARSDGVLVSVPTVAPQGVAILLADAATQTETSDEAFPQLLRSSVLSPRSSYRRKKLKAAFEEFKQYEDNRVEQNCTKMDARLDALSIDFDEELYLHMLTAIAELRQAFADVVSAGIAKRMSEGLKHGVEHGHAKLDLEAIEAYDLEAKAKYIAALYALKNL